MHPKETKESRNSYWLSTKCVLDIATSHLLGRGLCSQSRSCRLRQGGMPEGALH